MEHVHETILYVNLKALEENYMFLKRKLDVKTKTIAVVKAFAYGLGDVEISKKLELLGIDCFWVSDFDEGVQLRKAGITKSIIVANPGMKSLDTIIEYRLEPVIYNHRLLDLYSNNIQEVSVHLKFNSGMNRYGFDKDDIPSALAKIKQHSHIKVKSICSHLSSSNDKNKDTFSQKQIQSFKQMSEYVNIQLNKKIPTHILNSNGVIRFDAESNDWVRLGIALYGGLEQMGLKQIFSLKSVISQIRTIQKGECVGYQNTFVADREMKIAIIPVGYADGLNRKLGNKKGEVIIDGTACAIIGDISMDSFVADISNIDVKEGKEVIIFGPKYSVSQLANDLDTIPYEIMATLNRRIKRVYLNE